MLRYSGNMMDRWKMWWNNGNMVTISNGGMTETSQLGRDTNGGMVRHNATW